jgi:hypothetical protein
MKSTKFWFVTRQVIIAVLLLADELTAFRLSFDAQARLAVAAGIDPELAGLYPIGVDAVILITTLIAVWSKPGDRQARVYVWIALGFWTAMSVLGNAIHVTGLPTSDLHLPILIALAVNAIPGLSQFMAIHLATTVAFRRPPPPTPAAAKKRPSAAKPATTTPRLVTSTPTVTDEQLLELSNAGYSVRRIALEVGLGKTTVSDRLKAMANEQELAS